MGRTSACALGSNSAMALFNARNSSFPVRVCTMEAPKGRGISVSRERAVKAMSARMRSVSSSDVRDPRSGRVRAAVATTPIPELSMPLRGHAGQNGRLLCGPYFRRARFQFAALQSLYACKFVDDSEPSQRAGPRPDPAHCTRSPGSGELKSEYEPQYLSMARSRMDIGGGCTRGSHSHW